MQTTDNHNLTTIELLNYKLWVVNQQLKRRHAPTLQAENCYKAEQSALELELHSELMKKYGGESCSQ